jgi:hypothetical protein
MILVVDYLAYSIAQGNDLVTNAPFTTGTKYGLLNHREDEITFGATSGGTGYYFYTSSSVNGVWYAFINHTNAHTAVVGSGLSGKSLLQFYDGSSAVRRFLIMIPLVTCLMALGYLFLKSQVL